MRKKLAAILVCLALALSIPCSALAQTPQEPLRLAIATDLHYLSPSLVEGGELIREVAVYGDGTMIHIGPQIVEAFFRQIENTAPDYLILSGDLTLNGALASHEDFAKRLEALEESGVNVLALPGNHDVDAEYGIFYRDGGAEKAESLSSDGFISLYENFGPDLSHSRDELSFSYSVDTGHGLRIIMLDANCYGRGFVKEGTLLWLREVLEEARQAGDRVITVSHQNLYAHNRLLYFGYQLYNAKEVQALLEEYEVLCNLSGHIHSQSIVDDTVPEIVTSSLIVAPSQYGVMEYGGGELSYNTVETDVAAWAAERELSYEALLNFEQSAEDFFMDNCRRQVAEMYADAGLADEELSLLQESFARLNLDYFTGALPDYTALEPGLELWRAQEKNFTQMYIETMCQIEKDSRSFNLAIDMD